MNDIKDSEIYSYLLKQIAPNDAGVTMEALTVSIIDAKRSAEWKYRGGKKESFVKSFTDLEPIVVCLLGILLHILMCIL